MILILNDNDNDNDNDSETLFQQLNNEHKVKLISTIEAAQCDHIKLLPLLQYIKSNFVVLDFRLHDDNFDVLKGRQTQAREKDRETKNKRERQIDRKERKKQTNKRT